MNDLTGSWECSRTTPGCRPGRVISTRSTDVRRSLLAAQTVLGDGALEEVGLDGLVDARVALVVAGVPFAHTRDEHARRQLVGERDRPFVRRRRVVRRADDDDRGGAVSRDGLADPGRRVRPDLAGVGTEPVGRDRRRLLGERLLRGCKVFGRGVDRVVHAVVRPEGLGRIVGVGAVLPGVVEVRELEGRVRVADFYYARENGTYT